MDVETASECATVLFDRVDGLTHLVSPIVALLPYAIFSLFHALTFTRTTLMPQFLPPGPGTASNGQPAPHPLQKKLQLWVKGTCSSS